MPADTLTTRQPHTALDADSVKAAYRRWAGVYDTLFGGVSAMGRKRAVAAVNAVPGAARVLEVGVGTGLALPHYRPEKSVTGIDLSAEMLTLARKRAAEMRLPNVEGLHEMDAEATSFRDGAFDVAVAMFVASVVPHPQLLFAEMRRVVRPGGLLLFVNHFAAERGPRWWAERALAPLSRKLGWHPDFARSALLPVAAMARAGFESVPPLGLFTLVRLPN